MTAPAVQAKGQCDSTSHHFVPILIERASATGATLMKVVMKLAAGALRSLGQAAASIEIRLGAPLISRQAPAERVHSVVLFVVTRPRPRPPCRRRDGHNDDLDHIQRRRRLVQHHLSLVNIAVHADAVMAPAPADKGSRSLLRPILLSLCAATIVGLLYWRSRSLATGVVLDAEVRVVVLEESTGENENGRLLDAAATRVLTCADALEKRQDDPDGDVPLRGTPLPDAEADKEVLIWPTPTGATRLGHGTVELHVGQLSFSMGRSVGAASDRDVLARAFRRTCKRLFPVATASRREAPAGNQRGVDVVVEVNEAEVELGLGMNESYRLKGEIDGVRLTAETVWGALRGLETLWQLAARGQSKETVVFRSVPFSVVDGPAQPWRGVMMDSSRHFLPVSDIKRLLFASATAKFNVFHWHIVDWQSFPFASERFPEMATHGRWAEGSLGAVNGTTSTYSREDVQDIVAYARGLGLRVVPELDSPGHAMSWGRAFDDIITPCPNVDDGRKHALNPDSPRTERVLRGLARELAALFPDRFFHIGADEFAYDCWEEAYPGRSHEEHEKSLGRLVSYVTSELRRAGKSVVAWSDILRQLDLESRSITLQSWDLWRPCDIFQSMAKGHPTLQSQGAYMDYNTPWWEMCSFPLLQADHTQCRSEFPAELLNNASRMVLGGEVAIWTERIDRERLLCRAFPRSLVFAWRLWSQSAAFTPSAAVCQASVYPAVRQLQLRMDAYGLGGQPVPSADSPGWCPMLPVAESTNLKAFERWPPNSPDG